MENATNKPEIGHVYQWSGDDPDIYVVKKIEFENARWNEYHCVVMSLSNGLDETVGFTERNKENWNKLS